MSKPQEGSWLSDLLDDAMTRSWKRSQKSSGAGNIEGKGRLYRARFSTRTDETLEFLTHFSHFGSVLQQSTMFWWLVNDKRQSPFQASGVYISSILPRNTLGRSSLWLSLEELLLLELNSSLLLTSMIDCPQEKASFTAVHEHHTENIPGLRRSESCLHSSCVNDRPLFSLPSVQADLYSF